MDVGKKQLCLGTLGEIGVLRRGNQGWNLIRKRRGGLSKEIVSQTRIDGGGMKTVTRTTGLPAHKSEKETEHDYQSRRGGTKGSSGHEDGKK